MLNYKSLQKEYKKNTNSYFPYYVDIVNIYNLKNELMDINYFLKICNRKFILDEDDYLELKQQNCFYNYYIFCVLQINKKYVMFQSYSYFGKYKIAIINGIMKNRLLYSINTFITNEYIEFGADKFKLSLIEYNKYKVQLQQLLNSQILLFNL